MALGAQAREGKDIGIPCLKHLENSTPRDLLTDWMPLQSGMVELLIFKPARWLFNDSSYLSTDFDLYIILAKDLNDDTKTMIDFLLDLSDSAPVSDALPRLLWSGYRQCVELFTLFMGYPVITIIITPCQDMMKHWLESREYLMVQDLPALYVDHFNALDMVNFTFFRARCWENFNRLMESTRSGLFRAYDYK
jgi:hypothetical protein